MNRCGRCTPLFSLTCLPVCRQLNFKFYLHWCLSSARNACRPSISLYEYFRFYSFVFARPSNSGVFDSIVPFISCFRINKPKNKSTCGWCECFESRQQLVRNLVHCYSICRWWIWIQKQFRMQFAAFETTAEYKRMRQRHTRAGIFRFRISDEWWPTPDKNLSNEMSSWGRSRASANVWIWPKH